MNALVVSSMGSGSFKQYLANKLASLGLRCKRITPNEAETVDCTGYDLVVLSKAEVNGKAAVIREAVAKYNVPVLEYHHKGNNEEFERTVRGMRRPPAPVMPQPPRRAMPDTPPEVMVEAAERAENLPVQNVAFIPSVDPAEVEAEVVEDPAQETSTAIELFDFRGTQVRVVLTESAPQYVAADVCAALGLENVTRACESLENGSERGSFTLGKGTSPKGGNPNVIVLTEAGVNRLVFKSRKPEAEAIKRWLAHEVMPALRRKGYYIMGEAPGASPVSQVPILEALLANAKAIEAHNIRIAQLAVDNEACVAAERIQRESALAQEKAEREAAIAAERKAREAEDKRRDEALAAAAKLAADASSRAAEAHVAATTRASEAMAQEAIRDGSPMGQKKASELREEMRQFAVLCARALNPPVAQRATVINWAHDMVYARIRAQIETSAYSGSIDSKPISYYDQAISVMTPAFREEIVVFCKNHDIPRTCKARTAQWAHMYAVRW